LVSCTRQNQDKNEIVKFNIKRVSVHINGFVKEMIQYKSGYLVLVSQNDTEGSQLLYLTKNMEIDSNVSKQLSIGNTIEIEHIWVANDRLFKMTFEDNFLFSSFWDHSKWVLKKKETISKINYRYKKINLPIYEDNFFRATTCCYGEFGGAVFFYDKKTKKTYSCPSTCLTTIHKLHNSFYLASSMMGVSSITKIVNPKKLPEIRNEKVLDTSGWYSIHTEKNKKTNLNTRKRYENGAENLLDTIDISILGSVVINEKIYWIYSDLSNTHIGYLRNKQLFSITQIDSNEWFTFDTRDLLHHASIIPVRGRFSKQGCMIVTKNNIQLLIFQ